MGIWIGLGLVAGIPLVGLTWLVDRRSPRPRQPGVSRRAGPARPAGTRRPARRRSRCSAPLSDWLRAEAESFHAERGRTACSTSAAASKPYYPWFEPYVSEYVGARPRRQPERGARGDDRVDPGRGRELRPRALHAGARALRRPRAGRPRAAPRHRAGRPRARVHPRREVYHPAPHDLWRWTHEGSSASSLRTATWTSIERVGPAAGTTSTLALLLSIYVDLASRRAHVAPARPSS